jgi:hypothetical protein
VKRLYAQVVLWLIGPALDLRERLAHERGNEALMSAAEDESKPRIFFVGDVNPKGQRPFWPDGRFW